MLQPDALPCASDPGADTAETLSRALGEKHRRYTAFVNARARWTGHLPQGRFGSVVMDEAHLIAAARYIALNPVRARLVVRPQEWSSARPHLTGRDNELVKVRPLLQRVGSALDLIGVAPDAATLARCALPKPPAGCSSRRAFSQRSSAACAAGCARNGAAPSRAAQRRPRR